MKAKTISVSCPQCGKHGAFLWREFKRDWHLKLTCSHCGLVHSAANAAGLAVHNRMKELDYPVGDPPSPEPPVPVQVFPAKDGTELVIRTYKNSKQVAYHRYTKKPKRPPET